MLSRSVRPALLIFIGALFVHAVCAQENSGGAASPSAPSNGYPETTDGLRSCLQDLIASVKSGDQEKSLAAYASLAMPANSGWFVKTFGPIEGARLESKNTELQSKALGFLQSRIEQNIKDGRESLTIESVGADTPMALMQTTLKAMVVSTAIYNAIAARDSNDASKMFLGDFVYVDGAFRYIDTQVLGALSTAAPRRVRLGGNVAAARLINRVNPVYPAEARMQHVAGTVSLHVIIAKDGTIKQTQVVKGPQELRQAAIDAVQQWRYQPTLLNDEPVEVDTQIDVNFALP